MAKRIKESMKKATTVDKWKKKIWYKVHSPKEFDLKEIAETVASRPEQLMRRSIWVSVREIIPSQMKKHYMKVRFTIVDVKGKNAYTEATGHKINDGYLKKFARRKSSKIDIVVKGKSKDGLHTKIKVAIISNKKANSDQRKDIRKIIDTILKEFMASTDASRIVAEIISEEPAKKIADRIKKILPIKRVEFMKSEIKGSIASKPIAVEGAKEIEAAVENQEIEEKEEADTTAE